MARVVGQMTAKEEEDEARRNYNMGVARARVNAAVFYCR